tara:strand:- start:157 stop:804 length:648 start_codon:yes stop_codon:yes gene_type:complete
MKIQVPTHINDITLEQYQRFALINTEEQDKEFFMFKTIEIFCGVDIALVSKMRLKDAESISNEVLEVLQQNVPFTNKFELDGVKYGFIPDLQAISLGEFIDLEEGLSKDKDFHKAASVMFRPIVKEFGELYTIDGYEASTEMHHVMKQAPVGIISAAIVFFYNIAKELLKASQDFSSQEKAEAMTILEKLNSQRNTGGLTLSTLYAEAMLQSINK